MWLRLLLAPLLAPLLWSAARSLSWILIVLPILALYLETRVVHGSTPRVLPLSWPASSPVQPVESEDDAVSMLAHLIVRDFVKKWHNHIVQGCEDESAAAFPHAVTQSLRGILQRILLRLTQLDLSTWLMQRTLPLLREHVEKYRLAQTSLQGLTVTEEDPAFRDWFMATKYQHGELHPAVGHTSSLNTKETEHAHLRKRMDEFLHAFTKDTLCLGRVETALVREILACSVLYPLIDLVTSPDWIHLQIASKAERRLHELEQVGRVRESLSASSSETNSSRKPLHDFPASSPRRRWRSTSVRVRTNRSTPSKRSQTSKYERFLGRVENASSLLDVRRIRHELLNEIQRAKKELSRDPSNSRFEAYLCRLTSALDITEKRAAELGCLTEAPEQVSAFNDQCSLEQDQVSLGEILRNSSSLSYLLEFLNLCGRAVLVRFWIFVEAFKTPLEEVESDLGALDVQAMMKEVVPNPDADMCATTQSLKESMRPILDYCGSPLLQVRHQCKEVVETFLTLAPSLGVREHGLFIVRQCVLSMQADVLQIMLDQDWEPFTQSHLYAQAAEQVRQSQAFSEKTKKAASLEWDTESDDSLVEGLHPTHSKDERIPLRYGFLMGAGDGTKSDEPAPFRKPLFENDPLFEESESVTMAEKMWQPVFDKRNASLADEPPSDSLVTASSSMHLARTRHEVTTTRLKELHMRYEQLRQQKEKLDTFIKKAELTGASSQEQHVLQTARKAIERDARAADWEVTYLEQMLHQHGHLFDAKQATHVAIAIKDTEECKDQAGYTYNLYHIFVRVSMAVRGKPDVEYAWVVTRRYSAFRELHRSLRHQFRSIWACESLFPGKKLVGSTNAAFVESRRRSLERYLVVRGPILTLGCPGTSRCAALPCHAGVFVRIQRWQIQVRG